MKKAIVLITFLASATILHAQATEHDPINYFPNYHPLIVHFPIILLLVAALMQFGVFFF